MKHRNKVIVVGGGIMGASAAWHLSKAGAAVTLIERAPNDLSSATAASFGWVGASASTPSDNPAAFAERLKALEEFVRLARELGPLPIAARGALLWRSTEDETTAMIAEHRTAGTRIERLARAQVAEMEPMLAEPPPLAAWAPGDFALEPTAFARQLLTGAQAARACVRQGTVEAIEATGHRITGVVIEGRTLPADIVVLANGCGARTLASTVGVDLPIHASPAVLIRFGAQAHGIRHLICAQDMELRPALGGGLVSAADCPEDGEPGLSALATQTGNAIAHLLGTATTPSLLSINAVQRPMTADGRPLCGAVGNIEGLYAVVAHPGVILAPLLGRRCAEAVLGS
ncbi:glycine/D-amino acid oxidase-like deaminating enzyme [Variovorax sp. 54]|uniref:NAD(P)/FAD-dependent oxidoreductase n=1 Tax=Variovorax sp. 54 TaxID=2035212 RepID=UPI000C6A8BD5|nr:FAD-dependent oxidoreductase [Variovorax sp. 54]PIF77488.1 glycine/D-amino acid oxidase-like deaminating enzyme [Variovorax sp. 54]